MRTFIKISQGQWITVLSVSHSMGLAATFNNFLSSMSDPSYSHASWNIISYVIVLYRKSRLYVITEVNKTELDLITDEPLPITTKIDPIHGMYRGQ